VYLSGRRYRSSGAGNLGCAAYDSPAAADSWLTREPPAAMAWQNVSRKPRDWCTSHMSRKMRNWPSIGMSSWMSTGFESRYRVTFAGGSRQPGLASPITQDPLSCMLIGFSPYSAPMPEMKRTFVLKFSASAAASPPAIWLACS